MMFTEEEKRWFIEAAGAPIDSAVEEGDNGVITVTEPNGKRHEVRPVCPECADSTGTCECAN